MLVLKVSGIPQKFVAYYLKKNHVKQSQLRKKRCRGGGQIYNLVGNVSRDIGLWVFSIDIYKV